MQRLFALATVALFLSCPIGADAQTSEPAPEPLTLGRVIDGGARGASVDTARAQQELAGLSAREAALALVANATDIYGQLLAAQAARVAALAAVASGREDLARAERRRDAGV